MSRMSRPRRILGLAVLMCAAAACTRSADPGGVAPDDGAQVASRPGRDVRPARGGARAPEPDLLPVPSPDVPVAGFPDVAATTVPARFLGDWAADAVDCAARTAESRLVIEPGRLRFHEGTGTVREVDAEGSRMRVVLRLTAEGESRDAEYVFALSQGDRLLTDAVSGFVRRRCGGPRPGSAAQR